MSENPQVEVILEHIETRERELVGRGRQLRDRIEELTRQLGEINAESENLRITRKTLLTLPLPSPAAEPDRPGIPHDLCQALDLPILPKNTEGIRSQLKRLVSRSILVQLESGLFARPRRLSTISPP